MSLLLDALQRASKDKERAAWAAAQGTQGSAPEGGTVSLAPAPDAGVDAFPPLAPLKEAATPALQAHLALDADAELDLQLEPALPPAPAAPVPIAASIPAENVSPGVPAAAPRTAADVDLPPAPNPMQTSPRSEPQEPRRNASAPAPNQASAKAILQGYGRQPAAATTTARRRLWVLGGVAAALAAGLGSLFLGVWGDPAQILGLSPSSAVAVATPPPARPEAAPLAPAPSASASAAAAAAAAAAAETVPVATPYPAAAQASAPLTSPPQGANSEPPPVARPISANAPAAPAAASPVGRPQAAASATSSAKGLRALADTSRDLGFRPSGPVFTAKVGTQAQLEQAYAALLQGRLEEAAQHYDTAVAANPLERDALLGLAYVAHRKGKTEDAQSLYQRVLRVDPDNAAARAGLIALQDQGQDENAKALAVRAPDSAAAHALAAQALVREGQMAQAAQEFARALALEPANPWHHYNLAVALDRLGQYARALEHYDLALQNRRRAPTALGSAQVEAARARADQLQQALEPATGAPE